MYYTLYTSSEYEPYCNNIETDKQCLICLLPSKKNDVIKKMKDFSNLYIICDCNPTFHYTCLEYWINIHSSCPICRKQIIINNLINNIKNVINPVTHFIFYCNFNIFTLRIIIIFLTINIYIIFYL